MQNCSDLVHLLSVNGPGVVSAILAPPKRGKEQEKIYEKTNCGNQYDA